VHNRRRGHLGLRGTPVVSSDDFGRSVRLKSLSDGDDLCDRVELTTYRCY
jgi:hypothetical protein